MAKKFKLKPVQKSKRAEVEKINPTGRIITGDKINLRITQEIINMADPMHIGRCLLALALKYLGASSIRISRETIAFNLAHLRERRVYMTPAKAAAHIDAFDLIAEKKGATAAREATKPFSFQLQHPAKAPIAERPGTGRGADKKPRRKERTRPCTPDFKFSTRRSRGLRVVEVATRRKAA